MTDRDALYTTILNDPSEDTARLVLSDLLRESDDPEGQARGRFLWGGVTAAQYRDHEFIDDPLYYTALREIEDVAAAGCPARWLSLLGLGPPTLTVRDWGWDCTLDRVTVRVGTILGVFARGLLAELSLTQEEWYSVASEVLCSWPLETANIVDVSGLSFAIEPAVDGWRLRGRLKAPGRRISLSRGLVPETVSPGVMLAQTPADWWADELFPSREVLVQEIRSASVRLVNDLREVAADRWPRGRK